MYGYKLMTSTYSIVNFRASYSVGVRSLFNTRTGRRGYTKDFFYYGMRQQFGFLFRYTSIIEFAFPLQLDQISSTCCLL